MPVAAQGAGELRTRPVTVAQPSTRGDIGDLSAGLSLGNTVGMETMWRSNSAWTTDKVYMNLGIALLQKKDTGVSSRYSYKLFLYLLFYTRKQTCFNLTMLFNVSHLSFSFLFLWPLVMPQIIHSNSKLYIFVFQ